MTLCFLQVVQVNLQLIQQRFQLTIHGQYQVLLALCIVFQLRFVLIIDPYLCLQSGTLVSLGVTNGVAGLGVIGGLVKSIVSPFAVSRQVL